MGKRGPETERSPAEVAVVVLTGAPCCEATRSVCRRSDRAWRERWPERRRRRGADGPAASVLAGFGVAATVPRRLKIQAPEPDFEPGGEGVRAAH
jgi:hypothetical protein